MPVSKLVLLYFFAVTFDITLSEVFTTINLTKYTALYSMQ